jgi:hypothetical protein
MRISFGVADRLHQNEVPKFIARERAHGSPFDADIGRAIVPVARRRRRLCAPRPSQRRFFLITRAAAGQVLIHYLQASADSPQQEGDYREEH